MAGVMRRVSMAILKANARHVLRGLAIVGPSCIHQRNAREAARRAHLDAFGAHRGAPWRDPTNGGSLARDPGFVNPAGGVLGCVYPA